MYITYRRNQREVTHILGWVDSLSTELRIPFNDIAEGNVSLASEFRPNWLVRVSDMQVVPGSSVTDPYWALSYSWNQSGEIFKTGDEKYDRIDQGKHQIISCQTSIESIGGVERTFVDTTTEETRLVKFEELIKQMCHDFGIQYLWYDQMCIDQSDHDAKMQEIQQMHLIYKNAYCTLVLMPELKIIGKSRFGRRFANPDVIAKSEWCKRAWTLEEAYMSRDMLIVGNDVYIWSDRIATPLTTATGNYMSSLKEKDKWKASTALRYAKTRTSSKAHDRVFALANIFPELKDCIAFGYDQPLLDLMVQFYGHLAQNDLSILCFGKLLVTDIDNDILSEAQWAEADLLPSWTGAKGHHVTQQWFNQDAEMRAIYYIDERFMHMKCTCVPLRINRLADESMHRLEEDCYLSHSFMTGRMSPESDTSGDDGIPAHLTFAKMPSSAKDQYWETTNYDLQATHILPIKKEEAGWINTLSSPTDIGGCLSLIDDEQAEYLILSDVCFRSSPYRYSCYPVVAKNGNYFKSVGVCFLTPNIEITFDLKTTQRIVIE
ncbi:hypothetical protein BJV82DRAFT_629777 [Fennellomyces sp. T-0311]|nr:hypothetical protein BJV82DRAFT_629777 [Fennellomyces sp. T-0311]